MPPRRRSSRLRGSTATPGKLIKSSSLRLSSLAERDEAPALAPHSDLDAVASSPLVPRTPHTASRVQLPKEEMHPSKTHPSTTREPDSGFRLGFIDINASCSNQPSGISQQTPSKIGISSPPSFDFRFAHNAPKLGPEAQQLMNELRDDALQIKAKLAAEKGSELEESGENSHVGTRKIAQPKGKAGRFSDVHMQQFKKMDSIAGHASAFRAQPGRFTASSSGLKRTQSKANITDGDEARKQLDRSNNSERPENPAPAKRARRTMYDDISASRPLSRDGGPHKQPTTPTSSQSHSKNLTSITTPTQASLARASSVKQTQIPTLSRSPSKPNLAMTPRGLPKSATINNLCSASKGESGIPSPSKLTRVKSILRNANFTSKKASLPDNLASLSADPTKSTPDIALASSPATAGPSKLNKHVNFTPDTISTTEATIQNSPSPLKSGIPQSTSRYNLGPKDYTSKESDIQRPVGREPSLSRLPSLDMVEYPSLTGIRPLPNPPRQTTSRTSPPPSVPGTFTFRSDHTINFGNSPHGFGTSPGQASVRQVRQSMSLNAMPGSFPTNTERVRPASVVSEVNKENVAPSMTHAMANKKRRRIESDDENDESTERSPKKSKTQAAECSKLKAPSSRASSIAPKSNTLSSAKKGGLSLSRLNMLARPKMRK